MRSNLSEMRRSIEAIYPDRRQDMHSVMLANFGQWKQQHLRPEERYHAADNGDQPQYTADLPDDLLRWLESTAIVKNIPKDYQLDACDWERANGWSNRIAWAQFIELTCLPLIQYHIDHWRGSARASIHPFTFTC